MKTTTITLPAEFPPHDPNRTRPKSDLTNQERIDYLNFDLQGLELTDFITNLLHLAHSEGHDPVSIIRDAVEAFTAEAGPMETEDETRKLREAGFILTHSIPVKPESQTPAVKDRATELMTPHIITLDGVRFIREPETPAPGWKLTIKKNEKEPSDAMKLWNDITEGLKQKSESEEWLEEFNKAPLDAQAAMLVSLMKKTSP